MTDALYDYEYTRIENHARRLRDEDSARRDGDDAPLQAGELHLGLRRRIRELYGVVVAPDITPQQVHALRSAVDPLADEPSHDTAAQIAAILAHNTPAPGEVA